MMVIVGLLKIKSQQVDPFSQPFTDLIKFSLPSQILSSVPALAEVGYFASCELRAASASCKLRVAG